MQKLWFYCPGINFVVHGAQKSVNVFVQRWETTESHCLMDCWGTVMYILCFNTKKWKSDSIVSYFMHSN